jgi:hypothetical protein
MLLLSNSQRSEKNVFMALVYFLLVLKIFLPTLWISRARVFALSDYKPRLPAHFIRTFESAPFQSGTFD